MTIKTAILNQPTLNIIKKQKYLYNFLKNTLINMRQFLPVMSYPGLPGKVHPNDFMLKNYSEAGLKQYLDESKQQFQLIQDSLTIAQKNWQDIDMFLDLGSGYGRITRWVATQLAPNKITACDINKKAIKFCHKYLNVNTLQSDPDLLATPFTSYDFIFSCSVLTHLSERRTRNYFKILNKSLKKGGLAVFSIHGNDSIQNINKFNTSISTDFIRAQLISNGFFFVPYAHYLDRELGDTFFTTDYLQNLINDECPHLKIIKHISGPCYGWLHDWVICQNTAE